MTSNDTSHEFFATNKRIVVQIPIPITLEQENRLSRRDKFICFLHFIDDNCVELLYFMRNVSISFLS